MHRIKYCMESSYYFVVFPSHYCGPFDWQCDVILLLQLVLSLLLPNAQAVLEPEIDTAIDFQTLFAIIVIYLRPFQIFYIS